MKKPSIFIISLTLSLLLSACGLADLRNSDLKKEHPKAEWERKGRELLLEAWKAQGFDKLADHEVYALTGKDHWAGMMGGMTNPWPVNRASMELRYAVGTFDSRMEVLEGKRKGWMGGLQSWRYYEAGPGGDPSFLKKPDASMRFVLAAYQYFIEFADRMQRVPLVAYLGEREWRGESYEQVLATWHEFEPHKPNDQYRILIHKETRQIRAIEYTIRDNYLPAPGFMYGNIEFEDFRDIEGIWIPHRQTVRINGLKDKEKSYLHRMEIEKFEFDSFDKSELYPDPDLPEVGDSKSLAKN